MYLSSLNFSQYMILIVTKWQVSKVSKTLSGVYQFEICDICISRYVWMYATHYSTVGPRLRELISIW